VDDQGSHGEVPGSGPAADGLLADRYRLLALLGRGGMADVYRARDERLGRDVAVKLFRPGSGLAEDATRWRSEVRLLARMNHPGLVAVFDAEDEPKLARPFIVMEFVDGVSLADRLRSGRLSPDEVATIGAQLAATLGYVHARGVVHRDIKPANALLPAPPSAVPVKLADFGIARLLDDTRVTATGMAVGTANYLSPEQATGHPVSPAGDVYSLGLVLLECLTGQVAYAGHGVAAAVARLHRPPPVPADLGTGWAQLLTAMTAIDPRDRLTAEQVAAELDRLATSSSPHGAITAAVVAPAGPAPTRTLPASTTDAPSRQRRLALLAAAGLVAAAAVATAIALAVADRSTPTAGAPRNQLPPTTATRSATSPSPSPHTRTTQARRITTVAQALTALRAAIAHAVNSGQLDLAAATDLDNRITDMTQQLQKPPGHDPSKAAKDLQHKVADLDKHIGDLTQSGQLTPAGRRQLAGPLAALEHLIPPND
jgi:hypothetical protein